MSTDHKRSSGKGKKSSAVQRSADKHLGLEASDATANDISSLQGKSILSAKSNTSISSAKQTQSPKSKQKRAIENPLSKEIPRLKYPKNSFSVSEDSLSGNLNHQSLLSSLVDDLCAAEENNIKNYFLSVPTTSTSNIQPSQRKMAEIEESLISLLQQLPSAVRESCPAAATFLPELTVQERQHRKELLHTRELLAQQSSILTGYTEDLTAFSKAFGLTSQVASAINNGNAHGGNVSSSQPSVVDRVTAALNNLCEGTIDNNTTSSSSSSSSIINTRKCTLEAIENELSGSILLGPDPTLQECSELSTISSRSDQLLESLQEHCHHLAAEVERAERVLEAAKQAQEDLFHSLQDAKKDSDKSDHVKVPVDVRDVIRKYPDTTS